MVFNSKHWHLNAHFYGCVFQLENIGNFVRAITAYGLKLHDLFEANDLFENTNHTQVQSTLITLAGVVRAFSSTPSYPIV